MGCIGLIENEFCRYGLFIETYTEIHFSVGQGP